MKVAKPKVAVQFPQHAISGAKKDHFVKVPNTASFVKIQRFLRELQIFTQDNFEILNSRHYAECTSCDCFSLRVYCIFVLNSQ